MGGAAELRWRRRPPVTLGGDGDFLQHRGRRGKVRHGPVKVEEVARVELTELGGVKTATATPILCKLGGTPVTHLEKRQGGGHRVSSLRGKKW
jgi:hypothetical protein